MAERTDFTKAVPLTGEQLAAQRSAIFATPDELDAYHSAEQDDYNSRVRAGFEQALANGDQAKAQKIYDYVALNKQKQASFVADDDLILDEQNKNKELVKSLRRRFGHKNKAGEINTNEALIEMWAAEQHMLNYNTTNLGLDVARVKDLSHQDKADYLLMMDTWDRTKGTGEGSQDLSDQVLEIGKALLTDPLTYIGIGTFGLGAAGKEGAKQVTKAALKEALRKSVKEQTKKMGAIAAIDGGTVGALHETASQAGKLAAKDLDISENLDFRDIATVGAVGTVLGGTLGGLIGGSSKLIGGLLETRKIEKGMNNARMVKELGEVVSKSDAVNYYSNLGVPEEVVLKHIDDIHEQGVKFDGVKKEWLTSEGEVYKPEFLLKADEGAKLRAKTPAKKGSKKKGKKKGKQEVEEVDDLADEVYEFTDADTATLKENGITVKDLEELQSTQLLSANMKTVPSNAWSMETSSNPLVRWVSDKIGKSGVRSWTLGGDVITAKTGGRGKQIAEKMRAVLGNKERDLANVTGRLNNLIKATDLDDASLNKLLRKPGTASTTAEKDLVKMWTAAKWQQVKRLRKSKVIKAQQARDFMLDLTYMPRVYDFKKLVSEAGSERFAEVLNMQGSGKKGKAAVEGMIRSITGNHSKTPPKAHEGPWTGAAVRKLIKQNRINSEDATGVVSNHIEKSRKIQVADESVLDEFMVPPGTRMAKFFEDTMMRNELAEKFGKNYELIDDTMTAWTKKGEQGHKDAKSLEEWFYTAIGDRDRSKSLQAMGDSKATGIISQVNALQNLKLVMAALPNATQAFVYGAVHLSSSTNPVNAIYQSGKGVIKSLINSKESAEIIRRAGVLGEMDMQRMMLENNLNAKIVNTEFKGFLGPLEYLNDSTKFLRLVGFHGVEKINRMSGALMGATKARMVHQKLHKNILKLSVKKREKYVRELKEMGIADPMKKELDDNDIGNAGYFFNKDINFSGETINLPSGWQGPWGKLLMKFKSFSNYSARFVKRQVIDEMRKGNVAPAVTMLAAGVPAGLGVEAAREKLTKLFLNERVMAENRDVIELTLAGLTNVGATGLWLDMLKSAGGNTYAQSGLLGPGINQGLDLMQAVGTATGGDVGKGAEQVFSTLVPNVPAKKAMKEGIFGGRGR